MFVRFQWGERLTLPGIPVWISVDSSWKMGAGGVGLRALTGGKGKDSKEVNPICTPISMVQQS